MYTNQYYETPEQNPKDPLYTYGDRLVRVDERVPVSTVTAGKGGSTGWANVNGTSGVDPSNPLRKSIVTYWAKPVQDFATVIDIFTNERLRVDFRCLVPFLGDGTIV